MKKLNMTAAERMNVFVTYDVNQFVATHGQDGFLVGKYYTKNQMMESFKQNDISNAKLDGIARTMWSKS